MTTRKSKNSKENTSGMMPFGTRVLVKMKLIEQVTASGFQIMTDEEWERQQLGQVKGQLVAMGADAYYDVTDAPEEGDFVFVKRYAGTHIEGDDGGAYRLCLDTETASKYDVKAYEGKQETIG